MGLPDFSLGCQRCGRFSPRLILASRPAIFRARPNHIGSPDAPRSSIENRLICSFVTPSRTHKLTRLMLFRGCGINLAKRMEVAIVVPMPCLRPVTEDIMRCLRGRGRE